MSGAFAIRPYLPDDRAALYAVALATGRDGDDASDVFDDPDLLGHRYVGPYLDLEPELAFTLVDEAGPCGYVLAAADTERFYDRFVRDWLPPLLECLERPVGDPCGWSADERLLAELHGPTLAVPRDLASYPAHLHIDLLPRAQGQGQGRRMMTTLLHALVERGVHGVHLGVSPRNERAHGFYRALGFEDLPPATPDEDVVLMGRRLP
jgi:ribosomal protein S18 acetylase RimI-like enzyme